MTGRRRHLRDNAAESSCRRELPSGAVACAPVGFSVVGIGASAGGLEAFGKFLDALPPESGMAYILVQHLDPTHESLMVELLAGHTTMTVRQADEGMRIERNTVTIIPPGVYLSVREGELRLTQPREHHGARRPFDYLLRSLAEEFGDRAVAVILSGTGTDGSIGLKAVKERCGVVIAQDPDEACHDGMPRSAIETGAVDLVLPVADIPKALIGYDRRMAATEAEDMDRYLETLRSDTLRTRAPCQGPSHQRHRFLPRPAGVRSSGREGRPRHGRRRGRQSSHSHLDRRVQHRRGNLFPRNAVPRADRCGEAQCEAAYSSPPTSTRMPSSSPGRDFTRKRSRRTFRLNVSPVSSRRRTTATGSRRSCATRWSSRSRMCWPIRRSRAST